MCIKPRSLLHIRLLAPCWPPADLPAYTETLLWSPGNDPDRAHSAVSTLPDSAGLSDSCLLGLRTAGIATAYDASARPHHQVMLNEAQSAEGKATCPTLGVRPRMHKRAATSQHQPGTAGKP